MAGSSEESRAKSTSAGSSEAGAVLRGWAAGAEETVDAVGLSNGVSSGRDQF